MPPLSRSAVVQGFLNMFESPRYLEGGVLKGASFHAAKAARKVAVDPKFQFDVQAAKAKNSTATYHEVKSDTYFGSIISPDERFDVVFLDGLHVFEQTLRDLLNAIVYLAPGGIIVVDDILPDSNFAAMGDLKSFISLRKIGKAGSGVWMGDVYKVVYFIETFLQQFSCRGVEDNHGQLVFWRSRREAVPPRTMESVARTSYEAILLDPSPFRFASYEEVLEEVKRTAAR